MKKSMLENKLFLAYLQLEAVTILLNDDKKQEELVINTRNQMDKLWYSLSKEEHVWLNQRPSKAQQLRAYRKRKKLTQADLATALHIVNGESYGAAFISNMELGKYKFSMSTWDHNRATMRPFGHMVDEYCPGWDRTL